LSDENSVDIDLGLFRDVVQSSFSFLFRCLDYLFGKYICYFFLDSEGDTSDGSSLDSLHQVGSESSNFISHSLGRKDGNITEDLLVEVEIVGKLSVVLFNQNLSGSLDSLSSNSSLKAEVREGE